MAKAPGATRGAQLELASTLLEAGDDEAVGRIVAGLERDRSLTAAERRSLAEVRVVHAVRVADRNREAGNDRAAAQALEAVERSSPGDARVVAARARLLERTDPARAAEILHPLRLEILRLAGEPISASELAPRLKLSRQRVNYHVRRLASGGFLRRAGQRRRRNMIEQRYVASARAFLLSPDLLGSVGADWRRMKDTASPAHLLALNPRLIVCSISGLASGPWSRCARRLRDRSSLRRRAASRRRRRRRTGCHARRHRAGDRPDPGSPPVGRRRRRGGATARRRAGFERADRAAPVARIRDAHCVPRPRSAPCHRGRARRGRPRKQRRAEVRNRQHRPLGPAGDRDGAAAA